jgi:hypothetical protein
VWAAVDVRSQNSIVRGDKKGTQCPGVQLEHPVPGGYKYGNLTLQARGISDETVKYGREFDPRVTALARSRCNYTINYRPVLSSERALQNNKHATV